MSNSLDQELATSNVLQEAPRQPSTPWPSDTPQAVTNSIDMELVLIPAGKFKMGLPDEDYGQAPIETPVHMVQITQAFMLGKYEVTQKQFETLMGRNPSFHTPAIAQVETTEDFPVEQVTWNECQAFCEALSEEKTQADDTDYQRKPNGNYACRAESREPHRLPVSRYKVDETGEMAGSSFPSSLGPVAHFPANAFELHDIRGNTWEWCNDWFDRDYYARAPLADPQGLATGFMKTLRGSDWIFVGERCMINYPIIPPWKTSSFVGFRIACELVESK